MAIISKPNTFSAGATIVASEHNSNFDTIYDDYNGNITNANIAAGAAIVGTKLNLATPGTIGSGTASPGTFTDLTSTGDTTIGNASGDALTFNPNAWTLSNAVTVTGTWTDLGTVTTVDINGGTLNGMTVLGLSETSAPTTAVSEGALYTKDTSGQPELFYREESDGDEVQMTSGGNINSFGTLLSTTSGSGTNTGDITIAASKKYIVTMDISGNSGNQSEASIRFNSSATATGYAWVGESKTMGTTPVITTDGDDSDSRIALALTTNGYITEITEGVSDGFLSGHFYIDTNKENTGVSAKVNGQFIIKEHNAGTRRFALCTFGGVNIEDLTIASFELVFEESCTYAIKLYELV